MAAKMGARHIDEVEKMRDFNDSVDYMAFNAGVTFVDLCVNDIDLCGNVLRYLKKWMKEEALHALES